jgi:tellurite resistance protein
MRDNPPTLVFAAVGQARADGVITPEEESRALAYLLNYWALRSTLDIAEVCATQPMARPWRQRTQIRIPAAAALAAV